MLKKISLTMLLVLMSVTSWSGEDDALSPAVTSTEDSNAEWDQWHVNVLQEYLPGTRLVGFCRRPDDTEEFQALKDSARFTEEWFFAPSGKAHPRDVLEGKIKDAQGIFNWDGDKTEAVWMGSQYPRFAYACNLCYHPTGAAYGVRFLLLAKCLYSKLEEMPGNVQDWAGADKGNGVIYLARLGEQLQNHLLVFPNNQHVMPQQVLAVTCNGHFCSKREVAPENFNALVASVVGFKEIDALMNIAGLAAELFEMVE
jgi:hypothetical protein